MGILPAPQTAVHRWLCAVAAASLRLAVHSVKGNLSERVSLSVARCEWGGDPRFAIGEIDPFKSSTFSPFYDIGY